MDLDPQIEELINEGKDLLGQRFFFHSVNEYPDSIDDFIMKQRIRSKGGLVLDRANTLSKDYLDFFVLPPPSQAKRDTEDVKKLAHTAERRGVRVVTREWISNTFNV